jgi:acetamidase/formamidase/alpha-ketoglutarate-dependent taurine dioxygenase
MTKVLSPLGVETSSLPTTDTEWKELARAMSEEGRGVLVFRNLDVTPQELETVLSKLGQVLGHDLLPYERWPGQSPGIDGCPHLALLGNYKARTANELVEGGCTVGERIAEFKPASLQLSEWHTDGSFLARPKTFIALYAPADTDLSALPPEGGETRFASCQITAEQQEKYKGWTSVHSWKSFMQFLEARDPARPKVTEEQCAAKPDQTWPLVHHANGCLYINPKNTKAIYDGNGKEVDKELVMTLAKEVVDGGVYWHNWQPGDLVLWDNQCLLHAATPFDALKYERLLYRAEFGPHHLPCRPDTVVWGYLEERPPVASVESGAVVVVDTVNGSIEPPEQFVDIPKELYEIHEQVTDRVGPHILTGPIAVHGAEPGDTLQIDIIDVKMRSDWAWTLHKKSGEIRHTRLCPLAGGTAEPEWGGCIECSEPFFGVLGVAPPQQERVNSIPPSTEFGGNLDLKLLSRGSTLYLPVHTAGALLFVGDGHARQGDGECCGTALETALTGTFRLTVLKKSEGTKPLQAARAETPTTLIGIGISSSNLEEAVDSALQHLVDWIVEELRPTMSRIDAECLCSIAADISVTQIVNGTTRGAHAVLQKRHLPPA